MQITTTETDFGESEIKRVERLARPSERSSEIFLIAKRVQNNEVITNIVPLITCLYGLSFRNRRKRAIAAITLANIRLTPAQKSECVAVLRKTLHGGPPPSAIRKLQFTITTGLIVGTCFVIGIDLTFGYKMQVEQLSRAIGVISTVASLICASMYYTTDIVQLCEQTVRLRLCDVEAIIIALSRMDDPLVIANLVDIYNHTSQSARRQIEKALTELLPLINDDHYGLFTNEVLTNLALLANSSNNQLTVSIMKAMEMIGVPSVLPAIEHATTHGASDEIRQSGECALIAIRERDTRQRERETLLRPTTAPTQNILLRPASGVNTTSQELLLKPSERNIDGESSPQ